MSDPITQLQAEITQLTDAIQKLTGQPELLAPIQAKLAEQQQQLAALQAAPPPASIAGPQIHGAVSAEHDINVATNQEIHSTDTGGGDNLQVGNISNASGIALGSSAQSAVSTNTSSTTNTTSAPPTPAPEPVASQPETAPEPPPEPSPMLAATSSTEPTPSTPTTSAEAAATLLAETRQVLASPDQPKPEIRQELSNTIAQLQQALQQLPSDYADEAEAVADAVSQAIDYLTRPKPNRLSIEIAEDGMEQAAMHLATILPVAVEHIRTINQHIELLMV